MELDLTKYNKNQLVEKGIFIINIIYLSDTKYYGLY